MFLPCQDGFSWTLEDTPRLADVFRSRMSQGQQWLILHHDRWCFCNSVMGEIVCLYTAGLDVQFRIFLAEIRCLCKCLTTPKRLRCAEEELRRDAAVLCLVWNNGQKKQKAQLTVMSVWMWSPIQERFLQDVMRFSGADFFQLWFICIFMFSLVPSGAEIWCMSQVSDIKVQLNSGGLFWLQSFENNHLI